MMKSIFLIAVAGTALLLGCAMQEDVLYLDQRISEYEQRHAAIEQRLVDLEQRYRVFEKDLHSKLDDGRASRRNAEQSLRGQLADFRVLLNETRDEVRLLNGQVEETQYLLVQKGEAATDSGEALDNRLERLDELTRKNRDGLHYLEEYLNLEAAKSKAPAAAPGGKAAEELSEKELYKVSKAAFDAGDFETARQGFSKLLKRYPKSENADNSQFWIGEIHYREKWYEKAILEYQKVVENYPKGNKVPAALLKQGLAFSNLGDKANSRLILKELVKKYPGSSEGKIAKKKLKEFK